MKPLDQLALDLCKGRVLDVGAGVGSHSIYLQSEGLEVTALERSAICCSIMKKREIALVVQEDLWDFEPEERYDTIISLMNGVGIAGSHDKLPWLLKKLAGLLTPEGIILMDSSDISSLMVDEEGKMEIDLSKGYYGDIWYRLEFEDEVCEFPWLYVDYSGLEAVCSDLGLHCKLLMTYEESFLAEIKVAH